ncbi:Ribonuclease H-like domain [Pseudocohnilembus persalinus]|uniref:Ribonuclease H-like domain n=1 Tax=Pseudocohnilembus persalinus TaxID=266149 RepID=A0A0V0R7G8_PSEPJ|nr:Ribonuclease H-like domain [Pseudocohnilembus persalinus]|eukprot:KRX10447.1 Ribonuclease H-like domain [Pseudocohnilembus persalinus]
MQNVRRKVRMSHLSKVKQSKKVIEIGAVEMINNQITGKQFQTYLNPEGRQMNYFAQKVHGISSDFLKKQPKFSEKYGELTDFLRDSMVIMHNAQFDMKFLNMEIKNIGKKQLTQKQCMCSVYMASLLYQDEKLSLDSLCKKFGIDLKVREKHGALIDAMLLAQVYQADYDRFESVRLKLLQQNN